MKNSGKYKRREEDECTLHRYPNHDKSVVAPDHFRNFKGI